jgi:hypothetical protein
MRAKRLTPAGAIRLARPDAAVPAIMTLGKSRADPMLHKSPRLGRQRYHQQPLLHAHSIVAYDAD